MIRTLLAAGLLAVMAACDTLGGDIDSVARASTQVAEFPAPPDGTWLRYEVEDNVFGDFTATGSMSGDELMLSNGPLTLYVSCFWHCNRKTHPIDEAALAELLPLAVGNTATYTRQRADGSASWEHQAEVVGQRTVNTVAGQVNAYMIRTSIRGIGGDSQGYTSSSESWWSPELNATVYQLTTDPEWRQEVRLTHYGPEHP